MKEPTPTPPARCGVFTFSPTSNPVDNLSVAALVTRFLADISVHIHGDGSSDGISQDGAQGLYYILRTVEETIQDAVERL